MMSERRNPRTPGNARNVSTSGKTPKLLSNRAKSLSDLSLASQTVTCSVTRDLSTELDLAYNKYVQAIAIKDLVTNALGKYEELIDDQLAEKCNILRRALNHQQVLEDEIARTEIDIDANNVLLKMQNAVDELNETISDNNVLENIEYYNNFVEKVTNCLSLVNIKPFETQGDYNQLASSISSNANAIRKLTGEIKHASLYEQLCVEREKFLSLSSALVTKQKMLSEILEQVDVLLLKNISDKFAAMNGYHV
ncbi:hypothetical protein PPYR_08121 [Photinus pyralis]|uniref:Uncharacterized protein n=1 Tax=Photinus pyralis TaxID=7054 RepID=A0A1Y1NGR9_PHOPY|nr:hypothetical protein PPYR_08121 [Photinus pyralis]